MSQSRSDWAARVLNRHRHNAVGTWQGYPDRVVQVYMGAEVAVLTIEEAVRAARGYEACDADSSQTTE